MTKITEIKITNHTGFFSNKNFSWVNLKPFSIVVGTNGSGKTQLLEYLSSSDHFNSKYLIRYINVNYSPPLHKYANEIEGNYNNSFLNKDGEYFSVGKTGEKTNWTSGIKNFKQSNILYTMDYAIIDNIIKERRIFQNDVLKLRAELDRLDNYKTTFNLKDLLPVNQDNDYPWDRIDRILCEFDLLIRVDRANLNAGLEFLRRSTQDSSEVLLEMKDLCSGEKQAFALALWTWGNSLGQKTDILLVDEFDAHLNPSIIEKFLSILKEYFVDLDVQVIMTTHHPSTVAYAHKIEADIIWMEDGVIDPEMSYENIIRILSNGLIDINSLSQDIHLLIENRYKIIIFTEGKTDKKHIENAITALGYEKHFDSYFIFGCTGADTILDFVELPTGQAKRIVLLDNDEKGNEVFQRLVNKPSLKQKIAEGKLTVHFVSSEKNHVIEDLFPKELGSKNKNKDKFAFLMSKTENCTHENFSNFKILLDKFLEN